MNLRFGKNEDCEDRADSGFPFCNRRHDCWSCGPVLAEPIRKFTLEIVYDDGKVSFKAIGRIDFFEEDAFTQPNGADPDSTTRVYCGIPKRIAPHDGD